MSAIVQMAATNVPVIGAARKATTFPNTKFITLLVMKIETAEQPKLNATIRGLLAKRSDERHASIAPTVTA
ncbi:MAG TPA: hypothetical protein VFI57_03830, partial [Pyrinomonadaceae bacterium]|nr:hypothetical protein [Pyrinomonadaceae bacterium]